MLGTIWSTVYGVTRVVKDSQVLHITASLNNNNSRHIARRASNQIALENAGLLTYYSILTGSRHGDTFHGLDPGDLFLSRREKMELLPWVPCCNAQEAGDDRHIPQIRDMEQSIGHSHCSVIRDREQRCCGFYFGVSCCADHLFELLRRGYVWLYVIYLLGIVTRFTSLSEERSGPS